MDLQDIISSKERQMIFPAVIEEACRQWCCFFPDTPDRMDGEGFADFFFEIFEQKEAEYIQDAKEREEESAERLEKQAERPSVRKQLQDIRSRRHSSMTNEIEKQTKQQEMEF